MIAKPKVAQNSIRWKTYADTAVGNTIPKNREVKRGRRATAPVPARGDTSPLPTLPCP